MAKLALYFLVVVCTVICISCISVPPMTGVPLFALKVNQTERKYFVRLPPRDIKGVIIAFHGGGGQAEKFDGIAGDFGQAAIKYSFAVVYPEGLDHQWNDLRPEIEAKHDDVAFFDALLKELANRHKLKVDKVFLTGISNGGLFSFRLACERSEKILGIAVVAAAFSKILAERCKPQFPVSMIQFFGTKDPLIPYQGGPITLPYSTKSRGLAIGQEAGWKIWQALNKCSGQKSIPFHIGRYMDFPAQKDIWTGCPPGISGERYTIVGAGHTWPGGEQYLSSHLVGEVSQTLRANREIFRFFSDLAL